jgi:hypothetical protein
MSSCFDHHYGRPLPARTKCGCRVAFGKALAWEDASVPEEGEDYDFLDTSFGPKGVAAIKQVYETDGETVVPGAYHVVFKEGTFCEGQKPVVVATACDEDFDPDNVSINVKQARVQCDTVTHEGFIVVTGGEPEVFGVANFVAWTFTAHAPRCHQPEEVVA